VAPSRRGLLPGDKEFKRIAMRACKTDTSFTAMIQITASLVAMR